MRSLVECWDSYTIFSKMMDRTFDILNRFYLKRHNFPLVGEKCMIKFRDTIFLPIKAKITEEILRLIKHDRNSEVINKEVVKKSRHIFSDLGLTKPTPLKKR